MKQYRYVFASPVHPEELNNLLAEGWVPVRETSIGSMTHPVETQAHASGSMLHSGQSTGWSTAYALVLLEKAG